MNSIFLQRGNPIYSIKLGQGLPKLFSELHVKNVRFFLSYFSKKKKKLPTLPYFVAYTYKLGEPSHVIISIYRIYAHS